MGKASKDWFGYLIIDKDDTRMMEMCAKWINKGKWPKMERIYLGKIRLTFSFNLHYYLPTLQLDISLETKEP
jgi:hypothetical protein